MTDDTPQDATGTHDASDDDTADGTPTREGSTDATPLASWSGDVAARPDGGAAGADELALDPWGSSTVSDYRKLFEEFGIEEFDDLLEEVPNPHYLMRRSIIFGHRDYRRVLDAMRADEPFAALSGFMPTGDPHIGHKLVFDEIIWHQQQGGDAYALIADLEANAARGLSWAEIDEHSRNYLLSLLALGFDPDEGTLYRQSENRELQDLAFDLGSEANFSELESIYGFGGETDVSHMQSVITQMADILYSQLEGPKPTVIPVGPDQDPHVRLARDLAARVRYFGVTEAYASFEATDAERVYLDEAYRVLAEDGEGAAGAESDADVASDDGGAGADDDPVRCVEAADWLAEQGYVDEDDAAASAAEKLREAGKEPLRPRVRFLDRNATEDAFQAVIEAVEGEKRVYEEHVDAFDLTLAEADDIARDVEVEYGGYGFVPPSSIYHRFMTGLTGGKMSSSIPASHISLLDDPETGYEKVKSATTGGRETAELQRELGGRADECPVYELYAYLLAGDDDEFAQRVYDECVGGERLCGDCKEQAARLMEEFLAEHQEKREEVAHLLDEADIELDSGRT